MLGRERRQERRERREGADGTRYQMHQRMISIGDDYVIENDRGERVFKLDGNVNGIAIDLRTPRSSLFSCPALRNIVAKR